ncbi:uncharacterized protein [Muntiacus reevesi]|uniref:uncharacterized protein n=1 Tax=Muntiacus reevesi TaxID=9886 RepID=UPI0033077EA8
MGSMGFPSGSAEKVAGHNTASRLVPKFLSCKRAERPSHLLSLASLFCFAALCNVFVPFIRKVTLKVKRSIVTSKSPGPPQDSGKDRAVQLRAEAPSREGAVRNFSHNSGCSPCGPARLSKSWEDARQSCGGAKASPRRSAPQSATAVRALDGGTPEPHTGAKRTRARSSRPVKPGSCAPAEPPLLSSRAGCGAFARVAASGHWPSEEVLLAELSGPARLPSWEGRLGPEMPSCDQAGVPATFAPSRGVRLLGLLETS